MPTIFGTKQDIDNRAQALESTRDPVHRRKNFMNFGQQAA